VRALDRKLWRDLARTWPQAVAIGVLVACAVALFAGSAATARALAGAQAAYYARNRFADVWAEVRRAPEHAAARLAALPGVEEVETRVLAGARVELPGGGAEPVTARVVSVPAGGARLDVPHVRRGRGLDPSASDEVLVSEGFAAANRLEPGARLTLVLDGRRQAFRVVGVAISPEFVYAVPPSGLFPDDRHFGILWAPRAALAAALDLEGAFDGVALRLAPGADERAVIAGVDAVLAPHGGLGAYGRAEQVSHRFLTDEIAQLHTMATVMPAIFLGVTAFLVSIVLSRQVAAQRAQLGMLRAVGYSGGALALHLAEWVAVVAAGGALLGSAGAIAIGRGMAATYADFYRLPALVFDGEAGLCLLGAALAFAGALAGGLGAVRTILRLPAAEAMRPAAPPAYRRSFLDRSNALRALSPAARMVLRDVVRRPVRAALSAAGLACAVAVLLVAWFADDAIERILTGVLEVAQRQDATVTFTRPVSAGAAVELRALPGVRRVEPFRAWAAVLRHGGRSYRTALVGRGVGDVLTRAAGDRERITPLPETGLLLSLQLARLLAVEPGEALEVELLEGARTVRTLAVGATVEDALGVQAVGRLGWLEDVLADPGRVSGAQLEVAPGALSGVQAALAAAPRVEGVTLRAATVRAYRELIASFMGVYLGVLGALAIAIAGGVVYNSGRVTFAERERELATLRVIGFTRREAWSVVAGELALHAVLAVPAGLLLGRAFVELTARAAATDLYRLPTWVAPGTHVLAAAVMLAAGGLVSLVALRWVGRLDLVEALKQRE